VSSRAGQKVLAVALVARAQAPTGTIRLIAAVRIQKVFMRFFIGVMEGW
jgi:hypothetical protein